MLNWITKGGGKKDTTIKRYLKEYKNLLDTLEILERIAVAGETLKARGSGREKSHHLQNEEYNR